MQVKKKKNDYFKMFLKSLGRGARAPVNGPPSDPLLDKTRIFETQTHAIRLHELNCPPDEPELLELSFYATK